MKKQTVAGAAFAAILALALTSCQDPSTYDINVDSAADTVLDLESPALNAKAYYGLNYLTWNTVVGARSYTLTRSDSSGATVNLSDEYEIESTDTSFIDTDDLIDGVTYTYTLVASSATDPSAARAVYVKSSKSSATVTASVPSPVTYTDVLALDASYKASLSSSGSVQATIVNGEVVVTFPARPWLTYTVAAATAAEVAANNNSLTGDIVDIPSSTSVAGTFNSDSYTTSASLDITTSGTKHVYIEAAPRGGYWNSSLVDTGVTVTIPTLGVPAVSGTPTAVYTDTDYGREAKITWVPTSLDGSIVVDDTSQYRVYRKDSKTNTWSLLNGTISRSYSSSSDRQYFITDAISDYTLKYTYSIVLTDGTYYGTSAGTATLEPWDAAETDAPTITAELYVSAEDAEAGDCLANDVLLTIEAPYADSVTVTYTTKTGSSYGTEVAVPLISERDASGNWYASIRNLRTDSGTTTYRFTATASQEGYRPATGATESTIVRWDTDSTSTLSATARAATTGITVSVVDNDTERDDSHYSDEYTYTYTREAYTYNTAAEGYVKDDSSTSTGTITMDAKTDDTGTTTSYEGSVTDTGATKTNTLYVYTIEKIHSWQNYWGTTYSETIATSYAYIPK